MSAASQAAHDGPVPSAERLVRAVGVQVLDLATLAAAETRLAAVSALSMLLLVVLAGAALLVAWLLFAGCVLYAFSLSDVGWPLPALVLALGHMLLAACFWRATLRMSRDLTWPELRAALERPRPTQERADDEQHRILR